MCGGDEALQICKSVGGEQALDFQTRTQEFEIMCKEMESFLCNLC